MPDDKPGDMSGSEERIKTQQLSPKMNNQNFNAIASHAKQAIDEMVTTIEQLNKQIKAIQELGFKTELIHHNDTTRNLKNEYYTINISWECSTTQP